MDRVLELVDRAWLWALKVVVLGRRAVVAVLLWVLRWLHAPSSEVVILPRGHFGQMYWKANLWDAYLASKQAAKDAQYIRKEIKKVKHERAIREWFESI
jgi:nucleotide-binding universal stress UspA family protein